MDMLCPAATSRLVLINMPFAPILFRISRNFPSLTLYSTMMKAARLACLRLFFILLRIIFSTQQNRQLLLHFFGILSRRIQDPHHE